MRRAGAFAGVVLALALCAPGQATAASSCKDVETAVAQARYDLTVELALAVGHVGAQATRPDPIALVRQTATGARETVAALSRLLVRLDAAQCR
jgi:hypothetical protein